MTRKILITLGLIVAILTLFICAGCSSGVSKSKYDQAVADLQSTSTERDQLKTSLAGMTADRDVLQSKLDGTKAALTTLQSELSATQSKLSTAQSELSNTENDLEQMEAKYPPRKFRDAAELEAWLNKQPVPPTATNATLWVDHGLKLQKAALEDGYVINVEIDEGENEGYYVVTCTAMLEDNSYYWWDPDDHDLHYWINYKYF